MFEIPLTSSPEQEFSISISGDVYDCRIVLNSRTGIWTISFAQNGTDILNGIALVGGVDTLRQFNIPITNAYVVNLENPNQDPTKTNLGTVAKLFILTDAEVADV